MLIGKMFIIDGLSMKTRIAEFAVKNKNCKVCGETPLIKTLSKTLSIQYELRESKKMSLYS